MSGAGGSWCMLAVAWVSCAGAVSMSLSLGMLLCCCMLLLQCYHSFPQPNQHTRADRHPDMLCYGAVVGPGRCGVDRGPVRRLLSCMHWWGWRACSLPCLYRQHMLPASPALSLQHRDTQAAGHPETCADTSRMTSREMYLRSSLGFRPGTGGVFGTAHPTRVASVLRDRSGRDVFVWRIRDDLRGACMRACICCPPWRLACPQPAAPRPEPLQGFRPHHHGVRRLSWHSGDLAATQLVRPPRNVQGSQWHSVSLERPCHWIDVAVQDGGLAWPWQEHPTARGSRKSKFTQPHPIGHLYLTSLSYHTCRSCVMQLHVWKSSDM